jgi:hypothetical protein
MMNVLFVFLWLLRQLFFLVLRQKALFYIFVFHCFKESSFVHATMRDAQIQKLKTFPRGSKTQVNEVKEGRILPSKQACSAPSTTGSNHGSFHCARMAERMNHQPFRIVSYRCVPV